METLCLRMNKLTEATLNEFTLQIRTLGPVETDYDFMAAVSSVSHDVAIGVLGSLNQIVASHTMPQAIGAPRNAYKITVEKSSLNSSLHFLFDLWATSESDGERHLFARGIPHDKILRIQTASNGAIAMDQQLFMEYHLFAKNKSIDWLITKLEEKKKERDAVQKALDEYHEEKEPV